MSESPEPQQLQQQDSVWQWVASSDYRCPTTPTVITIKRWWHSLRAQSGKDNDTEQPEQSVDMLKFSINEGLQQLDHMLQEWRDDDEDQSVRWLISPPHSPVNEIAKTWANANNIVDLQTPKRDELCLDTLNVELPQGNHAAPWFVPELAHCYLRQSKGLRWVRAFFAQALSGDIGKGLVVCDSWAWSFLRKLWPVSQPKTLTLQAFDAEALQTLGLNRDVEHLKHLASLSRGNLGIACAFSGSRYRRQLQQQQSPFELPSMPAETTDSTAFILHMLLLHRGLASYQLHQVLPIVSPTHLDIELQSLNYCGLIRKTESQWYVTPTGYPVVRQALSARGLWLDHF